MLQPLCFVDDKSMLKRRLEIDSAKLGQYAVIEFASIAMFMLPRVFASIFYKITNP